MIRAARYIVCAFPLAVLVALWVPRVTSEISLWMG